MTDPQDERLIAFDRAMMALHANENLQVAAAQFEELVWQLLDAEARSRDVPVLDREAANSRFDGILPGGVGSGGRTPVGVEITFSRAPLRGSALTHQLTGLLDEAGRRDVPAVLMVVNQRFDDRLRRVADQALAEQISPPQLMVWGFDELRALATRHPDVALSSAEDLFIQGVRNTVALGPDWRERSADLLAELGACYRASGVSFILGAGTSLGAALPSWDALVGGLFAAAFDDQLGADLTAETVVALSMAASGLNSNSPLQMARYLRRAFTAQGTDFERALTDVLYRHHDPNRLSDLLEAIATLCVPGRLGPSVHSVITYNFDDLLESRLRSRAVATASIHSGHGTATADELPIYHVHGFLPHDRDAFDRLDESLLAFSEEGYHQLYADPYHWTNIVQLNTFRERTCVLLGLSLTDPNLRRLLEIGGRGSTRPRHYAFLHRLDDAALVHGDERTRSVPVDARERFLGIHHALQEQTLAELGVNVIWFDDFDAMPTALLDLPGR